MNEPILAADLFRHAATAAGPFRLEQMGPDLDELTVAGIHAHSRQHTIWLIPENEAVAERSEKLRQWLHLFSPDSPTVHCHLLPFADPYVNNRIGSDRVADKMRLLEALRQKKRLLVIATLAALAIPMESSAPAANIGLILTSDSACDRIELVSRLDQFGYQIRDFVEVPGDISRRGNVVDIFPVNELLPVRLEFAGNKLQSIRRFELDSQRSVTPLAQIWIATGRYAIGQPGSQSNRNKKYSQVKHLDEIIAPARIVTSNIKKLREELAKLSDHFQRIYDLTSSAQRDLPEPAKLLAHAPAEEAIIDIPALAQSPVSDYAISIYPRTLSDLRPEDIVYLQQHQKRGYRLHLFSPDRRLAKNLRPLLGNFSYHPQSIPHSCLSNTARTILLASSPFLFQERKETPPSRGSEKWLQTMRPGDWVVHSLHGVAKFIGFHQLQLAGAGGEFLQLEYQNREYLYVPLHELDVVSSYRAGEGQVPKMDRLGGKTWRQKVAQAKHSIVHFTRELLQLYARRQTTSGVSFPEVSEIEAQVAQEFAFVETEDQKKAIRATLADLKNDSPMDRLICGDVSFGKTEVALRAALRVAANGRQVCFLCPTTILALQHLRTFQGRLGQQPLCVAMLSRLVPAKEKARLREEIRRGRIDIVIGTHALLTKRVEFKNLGLCIIDEEQRFGVFQKEKLKWQREHIDVLTLSATPIPRTLSLAFSGLQDISIIRTPPIGRLAVRNYIGYFSKEVLVTAISNELERGGSVFVVYNRIERIFSFKEKISSWLPGVAITVIHAQMPAAGIEQNLLDFIANRYRVLVSTTIIENGIDIPAVNTLIVMDADRFGLTQLYQLRGRIGRSHHQAYAYFLVDPARPEISTKARKRLEAIREFAELGSGYRLAERDLLLRGAGTMLGNRQHGHMEALGFDYYLELLQRTVEELRGEKKKAFMPEIKVLFPYAIDESYIAPAFERIRLFQEILEIEDPQRLQQLKDDIEDRYGRLPASMEKIFYVGAAKLFARLCHWPRIDVLPERIVVKAEKQPAFAIPFSGLESFIHACGKRKKEK